MTASDNARLCQLQQCVFLRRELDNALFKLAEMMDGVEHESIPDHEVKFLNEEVARLNDFAEDCSDIDEDALSIMEHAWSMLK